MSGINLTRSFKTAYFGLVAVLFATSIYSSSAQGASRLKDISDFEGIRDNLLVGYGLVVGLIIPVIRWRTDILQSKVY